MTEDQKILQGQGRAIAPFGRRALEVTRNLESGGYRIFSVLDEVGPSPGAGQFYMLAAESGWDGKDGRPYLARAFSVAGSEEQGDGNRLDFLAQDVGPGTRRLCDLKAGERLWVTGPLGRPFSPPSDLSPGAAGAILIGGGIGVAPLAIWRRHLARAGTPTRVLLGYRDRANAGGTELFETGRSSASPAERPRICSEVRFASEDGHRGHRGYVTDLLTVLLEGDDARSAAVYACGPPAMLESVRSLCVERGIACELAMEAPMACGFGACMGCAVPLAGTNGRHKNGGRTYMRLCLDGPVVRAEEIETALVPGSGH